MTPRPGLEGLPVSTWLHRCLTADAELMALLGGDPLRLVEGVYRGEAPSWVVWTIVAPTDVKGVGATHIASNVPIQVKVVGQTETYSDLAPIYQRVHARLEYQLDHDVVGAGRILSCHRVSGIQYPETSGGIEYRHLGGLYEALTQ